MKYICFFLALFIISCGRRKELPPPSYINEIIAIDTTKIRFDGFYSIVDTVMEKEHPETYTSFRPTIFNKKQRVFASGFVTKNDSVFNCNFYKFIKDGDEKMGYYTIKGNEIYAYLPINIFTRGMRYKKYYSHFQGYMKNRDTIINWKMVAPYPKALGDWEFELINNQRLFTPQTLHFVATDAVKCLNTD